MKKTLVAQCVTALISGFALVGSVQSAVVGTAGPVDTVDAATALEVNTDGIGHILFVPYYSVQNNNDTYLNITNTDRKNGKAIKVRFRGASNSDDVFDITVLMSPGDMWTAAVTRDATSGLAKVVVKDKTCTLPNTVDGQSFVTVRLDPALSASAKAAETREGYIEILTMADIPPNVDPDSLYASIKHASGVPENCNQSTNPAILALFNDSIDYADAQLKGLEVPTTGMMANWTVINVPAASAYSGAAVAVEARVGLGGLPGFGNMVLSPQAATAVLPATARLWTSDPLLRGGMADNTGADGTPAAVPEVSASAFDFPDMSTPYLFGDLGALANGVATKRQTSRLMQALAVTSVTNEFVTDPAILGKTDWVFSMPTRRYNVARDYTTTPAGGANVYTNLALDDIDAAIAGAVNWFTPANVATTKLLADGTTVICVKGIATSGGAFAIVPENLNQAVTADREEKFGGTPTEFVISPGAPAAPLTICGEASVLSFNSPVTQASVLGGTITRQDLTLAGQGFVDGWLRIATPGLNVAPNQGLPVVGQAFMQYSNGPISSNYGVNFPHRATRY